MTPAADSVLLPEPGKNATVLMPGAAGALEVLLATPREPARGLALICHPHPLAGGAMTNKIVYALGTTALNAGLITLRFNFRGVGRSEGAHDDARGETDDAVQLAQWLQAARPGLPLLLAGFSFGAFVALKASERVPPKALVSIAPPFGRYFTGDTLPQRPDAPWLVMHSRDDEVVAYDETAAALAQYTPAPELVTVDGAGHFFHGRLADITEQVSSFLAREFPPANGA